MKEKNPYLCDQRRTKRYDILLKLNYLDPATNCRGKSMARNVCKTGLRFPVTTKMQRGSILDMKIEDPFSGSFIPSKAKVVWARELSDGEEEIYEIGVELTKKRLY